MITVISSAKSLDFESNLSINHFTKAGFQKESEQLVKTMRKKKPKAIGALMSISENLAELNYERFQNWTFPENNETARPAILAFKGDVYLGLQAEDFSEDEMSFAQDNLRILSGLHGLLKPLDLIHPYRLEMGTKVTVGNHKNLYSFWGDKINKKLSGDLEQGKVPVLINLASNEYFKATAPKKLSHEIITPSFKENKGGTYKIVSFFAKKARGMMAAYIIKNKLSDPEGIKAFSEDGYTFNNELSTDKEWVFTRG